MDLWLLYMTFRRRLSYYINHVYKPKGIYKPKGTFMLIDGFGLWTWLKDIMIGILVFIIVYL